MKSLDKLMVTMLPCLWLQLTRKDATTVNKPNITNIKSTSDRAMHFVFVLLSEVALTALAIQGALSIIHTTRGIQVGVSVGLIVALLVIKYRSK